MKNTVYAFSCLMAALLLTLSACVKEPKPDTPHPPKPGWLITKIVASEKRGEPEGGPVYYSVTVDEYEYNKHYKPWLHRRYYGEDSSHLVLSGADTLSYDNKLRPVRRGGKSETDTYEYRFTYAGDDQYPTTVERYAGNTVRYSYKFLYRDTMVYQILPHSDTIRHVYNKHGNYIGTYDPVFGLTPDYNEYDNHPNPARYLNLNFSWVLNIPEADRGPLYSTNNWLNDMQEFVYPRQITYDAEGKVSRSVIVHYAPTREVSSVYYYTKPD